VRCCCPPEGAVAYAYLEASAKFDIPFFENDEPFEFADSAGNKTAVALFGIRKKDYGAYRPLRDQVQILHRGGDQMGFADDTSEFILDPCKTSKPYQVLVARVNRQATFVDMLAAVDRAIAERPPMRSELGANDTLIVPNIAWKITHHFRELEGIDKQIQNPGFQGLFLDSAIQSITFRLNRSGAVLASEASVSWKSGPTNYRLNRPFLVIMKKRDAKRPFFVMWVENAELLQKK
jgi:hypothetical protein